MKCMGWEARSSIVYLFGEDHTTFDTLCAALQDRFQVYLFDTRGHGQSTPVREYHYSDMRRI